MVAYNSFDDLEHYYSEMSAMGDQSVFRVGLGGEGGGGGAEAGGAVAGEGSSSFNAANVNDDIGRIGNVSIPLLIVHALDDPLISWRTMGNDPQGLVNSVGKRGEGRGGGGVGGGGGNVALLLTKSGGHVGEFFFISRYIYIYISQNSIIASYVYIYIELFLSS